MKWPLRTGILIVAACLLPACYSRPLPVRVIDGGRYGKVELINPAHPLGFVIFFTDLGGTTAVNDAIASALAKAGALVVEVNTPAYLKRLDNEKERCHYLVGDADELSRQLQRSFNFPKYLTPALAGRGEGGTLAELALAQAPALTIAGAASLDPSAIVLSREPMCSDASVQATPQGFSYGAVKSLPGYWAVGLTPDASDAMRDYVSTLQRGGATVEIHKVSGRTPPGEVLATLIAPHWAESQFAPNDISNLPLVELPVPHASKLMAVVLSGDGGWRDLDKTIAEDLQQQGIPVVGWDSLRYFWRKKTPERTAKDLATVIAAYTAKWHADQVALIGYSFGADVLPFAYDRLPHDIRSRVALLALLGFAKSADFEIRVGGWLDLPAGPDAVPALPATAKIPPGLMQCSYGEDENDTACPALAKRGVEVIRTPGGHHFNGDYSALARDILDGFERRVESTSRQGAYNARLSISASNCKAPTVCSNLRTSSPV
jgi:type IV secretory pathway VirJ component